MNSDEGLVAVHELSTVLFEEGMFIQQFFFGIHSEIIVVKEKTAGHVKVNKVKVCFTQTVEKFV